VNRLVTVFLVILIFFCLPGLKAQTFKKYLIDSTDHAFDMSKYLATRIGIMPVPTIITEPAVGYGGGLGLIYFHRSKYERETGDFKKFPPSLSMLGGIYTQNGTWAIMAAHQGSYKKDQIRYLGAIGYTNVNLRFYGTGKLFEGRGIDFNLNGFLLFQELSFRIKKTNLFIGANYTFFGSQARFNTDLDIPGLDEISKDIDLGGANVLFQFDTRDNIFTPDKGLFAAFEAGYYGPELGGDRSYQNLKLRSYYWTPFFTDKLTAGFRFTGQYRWGDVPFYSLPYIQLRGIPAMRYQGSVALVGETEWRWDFWRRWSIVGFTGSGWVANEWNELQLDLAKITYGTGFRYFIARAYGMHMGLDFAWGPEEFVWYITLGTAWAR